MEEKDVGKKAVERLKREGPISIYPPIVLYNREDVDTIWNIDEDRIDTSVNGPPGIYVHLPFCPTKCEYCYYTSFSAGYSIMEEYTNYLIKEIELLSAIPWVRSQRFSTVYFGGGTPTFMSVDHLKRIIRNIFHMFTINKRFEFCVEVRPGNEANEEKLGLLKESGVNRVSLGAQSFNQHILKMNGRKSSVERFHQIYERLRKIGFANVNIDVMSGMLYENMQSWNDTVGAVLELSPENITCYKMHIYRNSKYYKKIQECGKLEGLVSDSDEIKMINLLWEEASERGYALSDIAYTYSQSKRYEHLHRRFINQGNQFLGIGLSANSFMNHSVYQNTNRFEEYYESLSKGFLPIKRAYKMDKEIEMRRAIIYGMRRTVIERDDFRSKFGKDPLEVMPDSFHTLSEDSLIHIDDREIRLVDEASIFADDIARRYILTERERYMERLLSDHKNVELFKNRR